MRPQEFYLNQIQKKNLANVILLTGEEEYWKSLHIKTIRFNLFQNNYLLNYFSFSGSQDHFIDVLDEANAQGFFEV